MLNIEDLVEPPKKIQKIDDNMPETIANANPEGFNLIAMPVIQIAAVDPPMADPTSA